MVDSDLGDISEGSGSRNHAPTESQSGQETPESSGLEPVNSEVSATPPVAKRYGHFGKRRRSYTEEMFRCQFTDMISRSELVCNHLLWKNRPDDLREHLSLHMDSKDLTDAQVIEHYIDAKRIHLVGIPEDCDEIEVDPETGEELDYE